ALGRNAQIAKDIISLVDRVERKLNGRVIG
ncbi:unnamed protein product, partial [marine sediment metagenome]